MVFHQTVIVSERLFLEAVLALVVNTNLTSMNALGNLSRTQRSLSDTFANISSGQRINKAADDAAGLGVAENLQVQEMSARVAKRNINDGISVIQTYEGAANEVADILKRQRELAVQGASETLADDERAYLHEEFVQLQAEHARIGETTNFNGVNLTSHLQPGGTMLPPTPSTGPGDLGDPLKKRFEIQVGINNTANDRIAVDMTALDLKAMDNAWQDYSNGTVPSLAAGPGAVMQIIADTDIAGQAPDWDTSGGPPPGGLAGVAYAAQAQATIAALDFQLDYVNRARSADSWWGRPMILSKFGKPDWRPGMDSRGHAESPAQHRYPVRAPSSGLLQVQLSNLSTRLEAGLVDW